jgi:hypothetical protein
MRRRRRSLPGFIVIGAQRSGTTSLFHYLCRHPQIAGSPVKEVHFFDHQFWRGVDWYRSYFPTVAAQARARNGGGGELVGGEATPYYLFHPAVPARLAATVPDVRLVAILRNPVDRAYSHYWRSIDCRVERLSFVEALAAETGRLEGEEKKLMARPRYRSFNHRHRAYAARGLYAEQLERWFAHFPREQVLVIRAEDFFARPSEVYADILEFLGVAPFDPAGFTARNPKDYEPLSDDLRELLEQRFAEPNEHLAELLGTDVWWPTPARVG